MSYRKASKTFKIPLGTLNNKCRGKHMKYCGHPTALSKQEELIICAVIIACGDWGYPLSKLDVRMMTADYLIDIGMSS